MVGITHDLGATKGFANPSSSNMGLLFLRKTVLEDGGSSFPLPSSGPGESPCDLSPALCSSSLSVSQITTNSVIQSSSQF